MLTAKLFLFKFVYITSFFEGKMTNETEDNTLNAGCLEESIASSLPLEVVIHLMEFLSYSDRTVASQVCQHWYEASLHPKFTNQEKVVLKKSASEALPIFKNASKSYYHFMFIDLEINKRMKELCLKIAPDLKSLYLENCDVYDKTMVEVLCECTSLEVLVLENCRELFMPGCLLDSPEDAAVLCKTLQHLREINLNSNRYLSDAIFNRLISAMPNLDTISLEGCQISYHAGLVKKYYPDRLTENNADYASETVLTFWNFFKYIQRRAKYIKSINLSRTLVDSKCLCVMSESVELQLEELYLRSCEQVTNAAILSLAQHQKWLTALDLSYCSRITDQALLHICNNLSGLRRFAVRNCRAITDLGIVHLKTLTNLEELDISQCEQVTASGIQEGVCSKMNRRMRKLFMEGLNTMTSATVISLAENLPLLTHLNLSYCFNAVTDSSVQAIFQHQVRLRSLRLASCDSVTDAGLTGMGMGATIDNTVLDAVVDSIVLAQPRPTISLRSRAEEEIVRDAYRKKAVQQMCEAQLTQGSSVGYSLARLKGLQELDLRCCNKITDVSLKYAFRFLELQHLNLSQCQQITHVGLRTIGENNPSIDTLNLGACYNVTDEGIVALTTSLHRLRYLDIKGCNQLTEASVNAIVENCRQLRYLDASCCNRMSDRIAELLHRLPLQTFYSRAEPRGSGPPPPPPLLRH
uniref:F-box domain-containing protein n=1 Tax=Graphocephala atropunctata TaxID=36148 RepID=A0A1B6KZ31_9HEMI